MSTYSSLSFVLTIRTRFRCYSFFALLLAVLSTSAHAAELHASANQLPINLGLYIEVLEDPGAELTAAEARVAEGWVRSSQSTPTLGFSRSAFWLRLLEL